MRPDQEITDGIRMGAIALVSAVLTATLVIGAGRAILPAPDAQAATSRPGVIQASLP